MQIAIERHTYAPELNKIFVRKDHKMAWVRFPCPTVPASGYGVGKAEKMIQDFRAMNTQRARAGRHVSIAVQYCTEAGEVIHQKPYNGYVPSYQALQDFVEALKVRHNLPHTVIKVVSIKYICG